MKSEDPIRFLLGATATIILICLMSFAAFVSSMFFFEFDETIPFNKFWFWIYMIACVLFATAFSIWVGFFSYRGLKKIGNRLDRPTLPSNTYS
jgi:hypothetical protein